MADVLIEREDFLASLEGLLGEAMGGSGRLVFLGGEAGVGKTTLAGALADAGVLADAGASAGAATGLDVRRGCCDNITTAEALGPLADALPELAGLLDDEAGVSRLRRFQQVRDVLVEGPMLLLLEDVHWADEATLEVLRFVGRRLGGTRLMILATFRSEEVDRDHPLTVVMGDLATLPGVVRMQLPAFSPGGVRQLLNDAGSALDAGEVYQRTGGNPFYVTEVLAAGSERVPTTVRDAVLARVSRLSRAGRELLPRPPCSGCARRRAFSWRCRASRSRRSTSACAAVSWLRTATPWDSGTSWPGSRSPGHFPGPCAPVFMPGRLPN
ncbi:MAG TPA: AAA family ATPase [Streptosporangiaceae bacterium]|jgi:predicted ATPase|nr:AAA family ATPase [Streptosporangiaceae bacterium]